MKGLTRVASPLVAAAEEVSQLPRGASLGDKLAAAGTGVAKEADDWAFGLAASLALGVVVANPFALAAMAALAGNAYGTSGVNKRVDGGIENLVRFGLGSLRK